MMLARSLRSLATSAALVGLVASGVGAEPGRIAGAPLVYLRSGPGPENAPITRLSEGDRLEILSQEGDWVHVTTVDDQTGYVYGSFVERLKPTPGPTPEPSPPPERGPATDEVTQQLFDEVTYLRSELAELRKEVESRAVEPTVAAPTPAAETAVELFETAEPFGLPRLAVWGLWFAVGALSAIAVTAIRRSRSQRNRLRF